MPLKCLIVDDEQSARNYVSDLIAEFLPGCDILMAASANDALQLLNTVPVDILFLDVNMPQMDGFDLLALLPRRQFETVFITAYSQYAIKAIKENAADYLLKPIRKTEFKEMLQRVLLRLNNKPATPAPSQNVPNEDILLKKLPITHLQGFHILTLKDIRHIKADNTYTIFTLAGNQKIITTKPIGRLETALPPEWFFRIHKTYIINLYYFKAYSSKDGDTAILNEGEKLPISRYRLANFLALIKNRSDNVNL